MRKLFRAGAIALATAVLCLGGCAELQKVEGAFQAATSNIVTPQAVVIAINAFDAVEATATNYVRLPRCPTTAVCRSPSTSAAVITWIKAGRADRNQLRAALQAAPGANVSLVDVYNDLTNTTQQLGALVGH